jgi:transaldolase/glucose-6-phosphate isomerase
MSLPSQTIVPGKLQHGFQRTLQRLIERRVVERLRDHDVTLWSDDALDPERIRSNLHWLDLPVSLGQHLEQLAQNAKTALAEGLHQWVLIALGDAGLAAQAVLPLVSLRPGLQFFPLDCLDPVAIHSIESQLDLRRTFFILASKSGDRLEDQALNLYFHEKLSQAEIPQPLRHFGCLTEADSYLASLSRSYSFRFSLYDPPGLLASYRAVLHLGSLLTGLAAFSPNEVLTPVREMRLSCLSSASENPALQLAAFLHAAADAGRRYLVFLAAPSLHVFTVGLRQLLGSGLSKGEPGPIVIAGRVPRYTASFEDSSVFVVLDRAGQNDPELNDKCARFASADVPFIKVQISTPADLLAESYKWEIATVTTAALSGLDPFHWPDARVSRRLAMEMLDQLSPKENTLLRTPRLQERGVALYAETVTRQEISTLNLVESLHSFFRLRKPGGFVALLVFLQRTDLLEASLGRIRQNLTESLGQPVALAFDLPSRDLYGDLFRRQLDRGLCVVITADSLVDMPVPGAHYSFAQLQRALELGEFESLATAERFVIRLHLSSTKREALVGLEHLFDQALRRS